MAPAPQLPPSESVVHPAFNGQEAILADFLVAAFASFGAVIILLFWLTIRRQYA
jgi:hypothetical protein